MKKIIFLLFSTSILLASCSLVDTENAADVFTKVYSVDNLPSQIFTVDAGDDVIIKGDGGTRIRITKNTFVDSAGEIVTGEIKIILKEALNPHDMVLANLTTIFEGKPLETGGMVFINALANNKQVSIAADKAMGVSLPADTAFAGMSVFQGQQDSLGVKWINPEPLPAKAETDSAPSEFIFEKSTNATRFIVHDVDGVPDTVQTEVNRIAWEGFGLKITKDSTFNIGKYKVTFIKSNIPMTWSQTFEDGTNTFAQDSKTDYIFSMKKLGWANIDRLLNDPRTKEVDLITSIDNQSDFKYVYVTLVTQNMYIPGYRKKDQTFCFSHNDEEKQQLPVGETATIIATAYKNEVPYFAIQKITITEKQTVSFKLEETTEEQLKNELETKI